MRRFLLLALLSTGTIATSAMSTTTATTATTATTTTTATSASTPGVFGTFSTATIAELDNAVTQALSDRPVGHEAPFAMGVFHNGAVYRRGQGPLRRLTKAGRGDDVGTAATQTSFRLASITKTFTAIAVMQAVEEGRLSLDAPIKTWLPDYPRGDVITIRHLLGHTSGIRHYPRRGPERRLNKHLSSDETLNLFKRRPLAFKPGHRFLYTSYGYGVLGKILEVVRQKSLADVLAESVFDPLGLEHIGLEDSRAPDPAWPEGLRTSGSGPLVKSDRIDLSSRAAGGGARGTVDDLLVYAQALLREDLVQHETWLTMTTPNVVGIGKQVDYGLGFAVYPKRGQLIVAHAGGQPGTSSLIQLIPEANLAVVMATSLEGQGSVLGQVADDVVEVLLEGGRVRRGVYATNVVDDVTADGLNRVFSHGVAATDERFEGRLEAASDDGIDAAFRRFWRLLERDRIEADPVAARLLLRELHHPLQGSVSSRVGGTIAEALLSPMPIPAMTTTATTTTTTTNARLEGRARLSAAGPLPFFAEYVRLCHAQPARCPGARMPPTAIANTILRLAEDLADTDDSTLARLRRVDLRDVQQVTTATRTGFGASVRPDLEPGLTDAINTLMRRRNRQDALALARIAAKWMPRRPMPQLLLGELLLLSGDNDGGRRAIEAALASPRARSAISAKTLKRHTERLRRFEGGAVAAKNFARLTSGDDGGDGGDGGGETGGGDGDGTDTDDGDQ